MSRIEQIDYQQSSAQVRAAHDEELKLRGHVTNMKRTLMHSPPAYRAYMEWYTLKDELVPVIGDRALWVFSHALSSETDCLICTTFFRRALIDAGFSPETFQPTPDEELLIELGHAIGGHRNRVPDALWNRVAARYDTVTQVNLVAFAGIMIATNVFNNVVEVSLDAELDKYRKP